MAIFDTLHEYENRYGSAIPWVEPVQLNSDANQSENTWLNCQWPNE